MDYIALLITLLLELCIGGYWWRKAALRVHAKATLKLRPETRNYTRTRAQASKRLATTHVGSVVARRGNL